MNSMVPTTPQVGTRSGDWVWDGTRWVCDPDFDCDPCPPRHREIVTPAFFPPPVFSGPTAQPPWYPGANGGVSFGSVAPPNPTRGHFWWNGSILQMFDGAAWVTISISTDGTAAGAGVVVVSTTQPPNPATGSLWWDGSQLRVWDGMKFVAIGPGTGPGPSGGTTSQVFALVELGNLSTTSGDIWSITAFVSHPTIDTQGAWDPTTKKLTPKKQGFYMFDIRALTGGGTGGGGVVLTKNDTGILDLTSTPMLGEDFNPSGGTVQTLGIAMMNGTTDFVRMWTTSADGILYAMGGGLPMFASYLLP